mgnify:CR=1 FL=1
MSEERNNENRRSERRGGDGRVPPRAWLLWLAILSVIPLLVFFKDRTEARYRQLTHTEFLELFRKDQIAEGVIHYNVQSPLREITGKIADPDGGAKGGIPFRLETRVSEALEEQLLNSGRFKVAEPSTLLMSFLYSMLPFLLLAVLVYFFIFRQIKMAGKGALSFGKSRARMLNKERNRTTFKDVAGVDEAREEVSELVEFLKDPKKFQRLGGRIPKGILLVGPPGTGKTLLAKAIAGEAEAAFYSISGSDFVEMFVGVGASRVRDMFEQARKNTPCLVFIDEIDAVGRSRGHGLGGGNDEREQTLNALLVEMDGFDTTDGIIIIAATNRPDVLDPALLRPGRFDRQITVNLPDVRGREAILKVHSRNVKLAPDVDLAVIARGTPGFSGAELANLLNEAALLAARMNKKAITMAELEEARDKVRWGRERRSLAMTDEEKRATAWHEAGHALVNVLLPHAHPLHKVTIIPRGQALGATMWLPEKDLLSRKRKELNDLIAVTMAGRIAEELVTDDISSGAAGDIQQATQMAKAMVMHWGMSDKLGMVQYGDSPEYVFLGRDMMRSKDYSEQTAEAIDAEVKRIITENFDRARNLILEHRDKLELIAAALLEYETLDGGQVREIVQTGKLTPPPPPPATGPATGAQAATPLPEMPKPLPPKLPPGLGAPAPVTP